MLFPPLGLWYLWSVLERLGHDVGYRDLSEDALPLTGYDAYLVSGTSPQLAELKRIGQLLRAHGKRAILGGSHATTHLDEECLSYGYDVVVGGEADAPDAMARVLDSPSGTCLRLPTPPTLDHLLPPSRKVAWRYRGALEDEHGERHPATTLFTSRGCPFRCAFCETEALWGRKVRWVPFETVRRELAEIVDLGFTAMHFYDDILPLNRPRTSRILDILRGYHESVGLVWRCHLRTDIIARHGGLPYLREMRDAGLREVLVGVESGSDTIKANVRKGTTIAQDTQALRWCKELGIRFKASVILGLPGETRETLEATRQWILAERPPRVELCAYVPLPGTPIARAVAAGDSDFDIYWDPAVVTEEYWFSGQGAERKVKAPLVGTSALRPEEIDAFRRQLVREVRTLESS